MDDFRDKRGFKRGQTHRQKPSNRKNYGNTQKHVKKLSPQQEKNIAILENTLKTANLLGFPKTEKWCEDDLDALVDMKPRPSPKIIFSPLGTIGCALEYSFHADDRVAILNFASFRNPGGGARIGSNAQEEDICRCTNILPSLEDAAKQKLYPIELDEILYTPQITIIYNEDFTDVCDGVKVDVISSAAIKVREFNRQEMVETCMSEKINAIFQLAIKKGNKSLILGPFGCGAYGNDVNTVANLFCNALLEYGGYFNHIYFAFKHDPNNARSNYNYDTFQHVFTNRMIKFDCSDT